MVFFWNVIYGYWWICFCTVELLRQCSVQSELLFCFKVDSSFSVCHVILFYYSAFERTGYFKCGKKQNIKQSIYYFSYVMQQDIYREFILQPEICLHSMLFFSGYSRHFSWWETYTGISYKHELLKIQLRATPQHLIYADMLQTNFHLFMISLWQVF